MGRGRRQVRGNLGGAIAALSIAVCAPLAGIAEAAPAPPLGNEGRWITDRDGRVVVLHGFNTVNKLPPYHPAAVGFGHDDASFLRREGFNTVRLGVIYAGVEPEPGEFDESYLASVLATARVLDRAGIFVLFDFHQDLYASRFSGEGFPDWAVIDDGLPAEPDVGFPGNYLAMPALNRAFDHFWANDGPAAKPNLGVQDSLAAAWRHAAERFRGVPRNLGYNVLNEPWPGSQWPSCVSTRGCPAFDLLFLTPFSKRIIRAIRQADPRGLVWYAPLLTFDFGAVTYHGDTGDPRAGFAFNDYCLAASPINDSGGDSTAACEPQEERVLDNAEEHARSTGDALLMTEWGAVDDLRTLARVADLADRHMMSWQEWAYYNRDPTRPRPEHNVVVDPSRPPEGANVKVDKLAVLARPYPQAVAGTPERWRFRRDAGVFELAYSTRRADGRGTFGRCAQTEVFVPRRHFGSRYGVSIVGGEMVSSPGARLLRIVARPRASRVAVRLTRSGSTPSRASRCDPLLRLAVAPRRVAAGSRVRFRFSVSLVAAGSEASARRRPARGATVLFAGRRVLTDASGRARMTARLRPGRHRAVATLPGARPATASVIARREKRSAGGPPRQRRGSPRFTG